MAIFFTGCTHFGHANIIKLAQRPFASIEEMNEVLVERWNSTVGSDDTVYHLGDFSW
jgi:calcineurin-like phosphoesterase family protein